MRRRRFLYSVVGGAGLTAGCIAGDSGDQSSPATTGRTTTATETARGPTAVDTTTTDTMKMTNPTQSEGGKPCEGSLDRVDFSIDEVRYESLGGFELTTSKTTVSIGNSIMFRLKNTSESRHTTGNKQKYDVQRHTDDGWRSIYFASGPVMYTDEGIMHPPDAGFTWEFTLSQEGLQHANQSNYSVCEDLSPGDYRFVYWGVIPPQEEASDFKDEYAISVRFTVTE